jgi:hypothetical protein
MVMLNSVSGALFFLKRVPLEHLISISKKRKKDIINIAKITFDIFKILNIHILRSNFLVNLFN